MRRLDRLAPASLAEGFGIADLGLQPIATRKWGYVFIENPAERYGPMLSARLRHYDGSTEIHGRAGSNIGLFLVLSLTTAFVLGVIAVDWLRGGLETAPMAFVGIPVFAAGYYMLKRRSPFGKPLIDLLQQLLEAENITERTGDPIVRR